MNKPLFIFSLSLAALAGFLLAAPQPKTAAQMQIKEVSTISDLTSLATKVVNLLVKQDFAGAERDFDSTMKSHLPPEKLQEAWQSLTAQIGVFQKIISIHTIKEQQFDVALVNCQFEKTPLVLKLVFNSDKKIVGLRFIPPTAEYQPPTYAKLDAFQEQEIAVGSGKLALPGTLTMPVGNGPFPVVVLVHGSGPNDRDESAGPNKPFRDLAWGLASQGIAVLRYEKRTKAHPRELIAALGENLTVKEETIDDAIAAVSLLRQTPKINPQKIFVLGHSLGGMLIPKIGQLDANIAGLIVMAGNTRTLEDILAYQIPYLISLDPTISAAEKQKKLEEIKQQVDRVKQMYSSDVRFPANQLPLGLPAPYWLALAGYQPQEVAKELQQSILILQGERDYQVTMEDFQGWQQALSGKSNVTLKSYAQLNHLFLPGEGKSTPAEYETPGNIPKSVIDDIVNWIQQQPNP